MGLTTFVLSYVFLLLSIFCKSSAFLSDVSALKNFSCLERIDAFFMAMETLYMLISHLGKQRSMEQPLGEFYALCKASRMPMLPSSPTPAFSLFHFSPLLRYSWPIITSSLAFSLLSNTIMFPWNPCLLPPVQLGDVTEEELRAFHCVSRCSPIPRSTSSVPCCYFRRTYCWNRDSGRFQHREGPSTAPPKPFTLIAHLHNSESPSAAQNSPFKRPKLTHSCKCYYKPSESLSKAFGLLRDTLLAAVFDVQLFRRGAVSFQIHTARKLLDFLRHVKLRYVKLSHHYMITHVLKMIHISLLLGIAIEVGPIGLDDLWKLWVHLQFNFLNVLICSNMLVFNSAVCFMSCLHTICLINHSNYKPPHTIMVPTSLFMDHAKESGIFDEKADYSKRREIQVEEAGSGQPPTNGQTWPQALYGYCTLQAPLQTCSRRASSELPWQTGLESSKSAIKEELANANKDRKANMEAMHKSANVRSRALEEQFE